MRRILNVLLIASISAAPGTAVGQESDRQPLDDRSKDEFIRTVPPARVETLVNHSGEEWINPQVHVEPDLVVITTHEVNLRTIGRTAAEVREKLLRLPASAWPYGRVVRLYQSARIPLHFEGKPPPDDPGYRLLEETRQVLTELEIEWREGPVG